MIRPRFVLAALAAACVLALAALPAAEATHNNRGTIKVHDEEETDPDVRNVPHVSCDFYVEGFMMGDDSGWLRFYAWPPTGNMSAVTPTGDDLDWEADAGNASGEYHFFKGPYFLPEGHYRVEAFTDDGHPGGGGHFAKSKTFWVEPCDQPVTNPPCPEITNVVADSDEQGPFIRLEWTAVDNATSYVVYRAVEGEDFEMLDSTTNLTYTDRDVEPGVTYEYYVTAVVGGVESRDCEPVSATAIPEFPTLALGALALVGSLGAFLALRRR